jgi:hypothetical protein
MWRINRIRTFLLAKKKQIRKEEGGRGGGNKMQLDSLHSPGRSDFDIWRKKLFPPVGATQRLIDDAKIKMRELS